jgi:beta-glucosidase
VPDATGDWTFGVAAIGRSRVLVDDLVVCDNWTSPRAGDLFFARGSAEVRGTASLRAGEPHRLVVEMQRSADDDPRGAIRFGIAPPTPDDPLAEAVEAARRASAAIVVVGTDGDWETEGADRVDMRLPGRQDELIRRVAAVNPRTVVVLNTGSPVEMPWIDDVGAVVQAWFGGQAFGDALADVLVGAADPGGRLPLTFPVRYEDNPTAGDLSHYPGRDGQVHYAEDVFVGYRAYATTGPEPLFPFGHGLSYTRFALGEAEVTLQPDPLHVAVAVPVTNTGPRPGSTVVQLYVRPPGAEVPRPDRELKAFAKVHLDPGASTTVRFTLDHRSFAHFDPTAPGWTTTAGSHTLLVGTSSTTLTAATTISL